MKKHAILLGVVGALAFITTAFAADATGEWLVADRTARISIAEPNRPNETAMVTMAAIVNVTFRRMLVEVSRTT